MLFVIYLKIGNFMFVRKFIRDHTKILKWKLQNRTSDTGGASKGKLDCLIRHNLERENGNWMKNCVIA